MKTLLLLILSATLALAKLTPISQPDKAVTIFPVWEIKTFCIKSPGSGLYLEWILSPNGTLVQVKRNVNPVVCDPKNYK